MSGHSETTALTGADNSFLAIIKRNREKICMITGIMVIVIIIAVVVPVIITGAPPQSDDDYSYAYSAANSTETETITLTATSMLDVFESIKRNLRNQGLPN